MKTYSDEHRTSSGLASRTRPDRPLFAAHHVVTSERFPKLVTRMTELGSCLDRG